MLSSRKLLLFLLNTPSCIFGMQSTEDTTEIIVSFDVNKTIIASDLVQGKKVEQTVNAILAEFTYADWDGCGKVRSYYAFLTEQLSKEQPTLSQTDETFKSMRTTRLKEFPTYLANHTHKYLRVEYDQDKQRMMDILGKKELTLFPSFVKAIRWLSEKHPNRYTLYLRTFGEDLPNIMPLIEKETGLKFAGTGEFKNGHLFLHNQKTVSNDQTSVSTAFLLEPSHEHYGLRDDFEHWQKTGFQAQGGKPFPLDKDSATTVYLFLDDNANDSKKPIVCPVTTHGEIEDTKALLTSGHIVAVDPKAAILDEDYFIHKIEQILVAHQTTKTHEKKSFFKNKD